MKVYKVNLFGSEVEVYLKKTSYQDNNSLAIQVLEYPSGMPFSVLTVNIPDRDFYIDDDVENNIAFVDINNNPWAKEFIEKYKLGENMHIIAQSGYCMYPAYKFREDIF